MATKTKTSETSASEPAASVEKVFSDGLEHLNAGRLVEAATAFKFVHAEAVEQSRLNLGRSAREYLAAIDARLQSQGESVEDAPEMAAQLLLNRKDAAAALAILDPAVQAAPDRATLHYLKALAHALLEQGEEAAAALTKATDLDPDILYQFRLEPDFDSIRHTAPFAALLRG